MRLMAYPEFQVKRTQALESIDYQDPAFFHALTAVYDSIRNYDADRLKQKGIDAELACNRLSAVVKQYTNLTVEFTLANVGPSVRVPEVNRNNPLINESVKPFLSNKDGIAMIKAAKDGFARGSVDLKRGRVSGVYAEIEHEIFMPVKAIRDKKFDSEELAAITLHEVGHLFSYYECMIRMVRDNQVLLGVTRGLDGSDTQKEREAVLLTAKQVLKLKDMNPAEVSQITNKKVIEAILISESAEVTRSELGTPLYDANNFEFLADQFAARCGAWKPLVTGLDKLISTAFFGFSPAMKRSLPLYLFMEVVKLTVLLGSLWAAAKMGGVGRKLLAKSVFKLYVVVASMDGDYSGGGIYDRLTTRFARIKNDLVQFEKSKELDETQLMQVREDLKMIETIMKEYKPDQIDLSARLANMIFQNNRMRLSAEKIQQELESLVANDLFGRSTDLKALA